MLRRLHVCLLLVAGTASLASAAPVPVVPPDPLPKGATARFGTPYFRGPHAFGVTFSADGKRLLAHSTSNFGRADKQSLSVWEADTGKKIPFKFNPPPKLDQFPWVGSVLAPDRVVWMCQQHAGTGKPSEIVVTDLEGQVLNRVEVEGQAFLYISPLPNTFAAAAVTSDGGYAAVTLNSGQAVAAYDLASGKRVLDEKFDKADQPSVCFAQDRKTLFVKQTGKPIRRFILSAGKELPPLEGTDSKTDKLAASPDGKWVVTVKFPTSKQIDGKWQVEYPKVLEVYDGAKGKRVGELEVGSMVTHFTFADNGSILVNTQAIRPPLPPKYTLATWDVATRKRVREVPAISAPLAVSPDGKRFVSGAPLQLFLRDADGKLLVDAGGHAGAVSWVAFAADGKTVSTAGGTEVMTWELDGRRKSRVPVPELQHTTLSIGSAADRLTWFAHSAEAAPKPTLFGWDAEKNAIGYKIPVEQSRGWVFTPDGKHLVSVRGDLAKQRNIVTVHEIATGKTLREWSFPYPAGAYPFYGPHTAAGRFIATAEVGTIKMIDALTGEEFATVKHPFDKPPTGLNLAVSPGNDRLAVIEKGKVSVYEPKSGKLQAQHSFTDAMPLAMKFSPDGKQLVLWDTRGEGEGSYATVWDFGSPDAKPRKLVAESWSVATCAAFSPDGKTLAVGYQDGTTLLWDVIAK